MPASQLSRQSLETAPVRVLRFLTAVSRSSEIRAALGQRGYGAADHQEACELLVRLVRYPGSASSPGDDHEAIAALEALEAWYRVQVRLIRAALRHRFPAQATFLLGGHAPAGDHRGSFAAVLLLDRLDALERGPEREATRAADHEALALLARRGITPEERARLRGLVTMSRGLAVAPSVDAAAAELEEQRETLQALHAWHREWAETARTAIERRDLLVRLGLTQRKRGPGEAGAKARVKGGSKADAKAEAKKAGGRRRAKEG